MNSSKLIYFTITEIVNFIDARHHDMNISLRQTAGTAKSWSAGLVVAFSTFVHAENAKPLVNWKGMTQRPGRRERDALDMQSCRLLGNLVNFKSKMIATAFIHAFDEGF